MQDAPVQELSLVQLETFLERLISVAPLPNAPDSKWTVFLNLSKDSRLPSVEELSAIDAQYLAEQWRSSTKRMILKSIKESAGQQPPMAIASIIAGHLIRYQTDPLAQVPQQGMFLVSWAVSNQEGIPIAWTFFKSPVLNEPDRTTAVQVFVELARSTLTEQLINLFDRAAGYDEDCPMVPPGSYVAPVGAIETPDCNLDG